MCTRLGRTTGAAFLSGCKPATVVHDCARWSQRKPDLGALQVNVLEKAHKTHTESDSDATVSLGRSSQTRQLAPDSITRLLGQSCFNRFPMMFIKLSQRYLGSSCHRPGKKVLLSLQAFKQHQHVFDHAHCFVEKYITPVTTAQTRTEAPTTIDENVRGPRSPTHAYDRCMLHLFE